MVLLNSYLMALAPWLGLRQPVPAQSGLTPLGSTLLYGAIQALEACPREAGQTLIRWRERTRQRRCLRAMSPHLLRDIGVTQDEALREAIKPCWRG